MTLREKSGLRAYLRENLCWWGLLLVFAVTFFWPDRKGGTNISRLLLLVPVFSGLSWPMVKKLMTVPAFRWFAALSLFFTISLLWGTEASAMDNLLLRVLACWFLAFMLYSIACYQPESFAQIDKALILFGVVWVVILIADWGSLWQATPSFNRWAIPRGVFSHHLEVGWMLAALALLALQIAFRNKMSFASICWLCAALLFFTVLLLSQARGGYLVFSVGLLVYFMVALRGPRWFWLPLVLVGLCGIVAVLFAYKPALYESLLARGSSGRFRIWQNWYDVWQAGLNKIVFGYGLNTSPENSIGKYAAKHYHNFYLNTLFYGGLIGLALMFGWLFSSLRACFKSRQYTSPWFPVVIGMLAGFLTDGDKLFNYPGAIVFCFVLPMFCLVLSAENLQPEQV